VNDSEDARAFARTRGDRWRAGRLRGRWTVRVVERPRCPDLPATPSVIWKSEPIEMPPTPAALRPRPPLPTGAVLAEESPATTVASATRTTAPSTAPDTAATAVTGTQGSTGRSGSPRSTTSPTAPNPPTTTPPPAAARPVEATTATTANRVGWSPRRSPPVHPRRHSPETESGPAPSTKPDRRRQSPVPAPVLPAEARRD
jgi:hypothetical protein